MARPTQLDEFSTAIATAAISTRVTTEMMREFERAIQDFRVEVEGSFRLDSLAMDPGGGDFTQLYAGGRGGGRSFRTGERACDIRLDCREDRYADAHILSLRWKEHPADTQRWEVCYGITRELLMNSGLHGDIFQNLEQRILEDVVSTASCMIARQFTAHALEIFRYCVERTIRGRPTTRFSWNNNHFDVGRAKKVEATAKALLLSLLSKKQQKEFLDSNGYRFTVEVGGEHFEILKTNTFSVHHQKTRSRYCMTTPGLPLYDQMAATKLLLESDPEAFFKIANKQQTHSPGRYPGGEALLTEFQMAAFREMNTMINHRMVGVVIQNPQSVAGIDTTS